MMIRIELYYRFIVNLQHTYEAKAQSQLKKTIPIIITAHHHRQHHHHHHHDQLHHLIFVHLWTLPIYSQCKERLNDRTYVQQ
jgi:hypothetical protein